MTEQKENWFNKKSVTATFAIVAFLGGVFFLGTGRITGNVVASQYHSVSALSLVGLALIFCSIITANYSIKKN